MGRIAFVVAPDFEDVEFTRPYDELRAAGHECVVIGTQAGQQLTGKRDQATVTTDVAIDEVDPADFDLLVVPGGYSPDKLRLNDGMVKFTGRFVAADKPVAAICHAGQLLVEAGVVAGRELTSWPSVRTELELAGAKWVDREVVEDGNLITSRKPDDLDAFMAAIRRRL